MQSAESLRETLILLASELPPDDSMVREMHRTAANMTRLAKAVIDYAALHGPITNPRT